MQLLVVLHRWLGVVLSLVLTTWFLSGIVMMYRGYPAVTAGDRLHHLPVLEPRRVHLAPNDAFARAGLELPWRVTLSSFDGRPVYIGGGAMVYADDGTAQREVTSQMVDRAAVEWTQRPLVEAASQPVTAVDQWTLGSSLRALRPMVKYSWPDGQQVYVDGVAAEVVQYTTRASRFWAYLGAIPHWLYFPALRTHDAAWLSFMIWGSLVGCLATLVGVVIAVWRYSPRKRYRHHGMPAALPYHGWKRGHAVVGLGVGALATTWMFSGMLSLEPFRLEERLTAWTVSTQPASDAAARRAWERMVPLLLGDPLDTAAYTGRPPAAALASIAGFGARELDWASTDGQPVYVATNQDGDTRVVPVHGPAFATFDPDGLARRLQTAAGDGADVEVIDQFDPYYRDRHGALTLPAIRVRLHDSVGSRYYVNPRTATVTVSYSSREWVSRWLFHGLHSLDFPSLYNHRPLWDIVVLMSLLAGAGLCATSLVLSWRLVGRLVHQGGQLPVMSTRTILLLALLLLPSAAGAQDETARDLSRLQGGWQVIAAEQRGKPFDVIRGGALVVTDQAFVLRTAVGNEFKGTIRVDATASPKHLDFVHADGKTVWEAIYTVDEETFRLNYVDAGGRDKRPTLFATTSDSAGTVIVMTRMTEKK